MDGHAEAIKNIYDDEVLIYQIQTEKKGNCHIRESIYEISQNVIDLLLVQSPIGGRHSNEIYEDLHEEAQMHREMWEGIQEAAKRGVKFEFDGSFADSKNFTLLLS